MCTMFQKCSCTCFSFVLSRETEDSFIIITVIVAIIYYCFWQKEASLHQGMIK